jgi:hypothetical protein
MILLQMSPNSHPQLASKRYHFINDDEY